MSINVITMAPPVGKSNIYAPKIPANIPITPNIIDQNIEVLKDLDNFNPISAGITKSEEISKIPTIFIEATITTAVITINNLFTISIFLFLTLAIFSLNDK